MSAKERLGVLGGTFDPIHLGHLRAAETIREAMALDRILFVPARVPPHKHPPSVASSEDRYRMVEAAIAGASYFEVSRAELEREGKSYTVDTLAVLSRERPDSKPFCIIGIDAFKDIRTWKHWETLLTDYSFVVHGRPGHALAAAHEVVPASLRPRLLDVTSGERRRLREGPDEPAIYLVSALTLNVSSTVIRALLRQGASIRYLVPEPVAAYITENRLYKD